MAFRKTISQDELRSKQSTESREEHATEYQASRGGWFKAEPKPTAGTGTTEQDSGGRGRRWGRG